MFWPGTVVTSLQPFDPNIQTGTRLRLSVFGFQSLYKCEDNSRAFAGAVFSPVMEGAINVATPENHAGNALRED
jgi:hypothetical protein